MDVTSVARDYLERWPAEPRRGRAPAGRLAGLRATLGEDFGRRVAAYYESAPDRSSELQSRYERFAACSLLQYRGLVQAGFRVRPWLRDGQPYSGFRQLRDQLRRSRTVHVFLTSAGHGPEAPAGPHPLREPSGVVVDGVEFCHNDILRAVHDVFGHLLADAGFGPMGEFAAVYSQMRLYPPDLHDILFAEQVGQICWFFYGPHLSDRSGTLPGPGDAAYTPPPHRPYPQQKIVEFEAHFIDEFREAFRAKEALA
jgi:hypothetical protein